MPSSILKPPRLRKGDTIGLVSPASPPSSGEKIEKGVRYLEHLGYRVEVGKHVLDQNGYLAGSDEDRAADFNAMIRAKTVKAVFAIRGGYGTPRILPLIDFAALRRNPKILVGYSDLTALQLAAYRKMGLVTFSGPMAGVEMWNGIDPYTEEHFWRLITSAAPPGVLANPPEENLGFSGSRNVSGKLLGGNLSLVISILATPYSPQYERSLLVLEEVDEAPHRVDRMFTQLFHSGILNKISALILGHFTDCRPVDPSKPSLTVDQVLRDVINKLSIPVIINLQYGHIPKKLTIPFGIRARLHPSESLLEIRESAVR